MEWEKYIKKITNWVLKHPNASFIFLFCLLVLVRFMMFRKGNYILSFVAALIFRLILKPLIRDQEKRYNDLLVKIGFQEIDLDTIDWESDDIPKVLEVIFQANREVVPTAMIHIYRHYTENVDSDITTYILSFAFSKRIFVNNFSVKERLLDEIRLRAVEYLSRETGMAVDDVDFKNEVRSALLLEIWFTDIPMEKCYWMVKPYIGGDRVKATHGVRITPEGKAAGVALVSQNYNAAEGTFEIDDKKTKIAFNRNIPVIVGPRTLETGVIDIYSKNAAGKFTINDLMLDWHQKLHLDIAEYGNSFEMINRWVSDRGGFIEFKGHYNAGKFYPAANKYQTSLKKNLSNIFQNADVPIVKGVKKVENLLQKFVLDNQPIVQGTLAEDGNFEIEYKQSKNGIKKQYHIKKLHWMTKFFPKDDYDSDAYKVPANYRQFFFDDGGCAPIPFTEGYLMTGTGDNNWLCLFVSAGSPAASAGNGVSKSADEQLELFLQAYAHHNKITNLNLVNEATQGLVIKGTRGNTDLYLKLLNPDIANFYLTDDIISSLLAKDILPPIIKIKHINRFGKEDQNGILLFETPAFPSLADKVNRQKLGYDSKNKYSRELAAFSKQLLDNDVICTDFTLKDTVDYNDGGKEYLFVCDYGSYIKQQHFKRGNLVCKPEYEAPEDKYEDVQLLPEPYQVFKLGILFYQLMKNSAYQFPDLNFYDKNSYNDSLDKSIYLLSAKLPEKHYGILKLISAMLSYEPTERPGLKEIIDKINI